MIKSGSFVARDGKKYSVAIEGDNVWRETLTFSVPPVVISMAQGEHKYCGFRSTTAVINILTNHMMTDLYTERADGVPVEVYNLTDDVPVFYGYVVPFAYDQPLTGCNDVLTVNAVDLITARKDIPYENIGDVHGVDLPALKIVQGICERAGITRLVVHNNFNDGNDMMANASPLDVKVAQAGFLQDKVSDTDALGAICKFFGYTGHVVGDTLYMYDEYAMLHGVTSSNTYNLVSALGTTGWMLVEHHAEGDIDAVIGRENVYDADVVGESRVSIERSYDGIQITPQGSEVSVLLPNVCAKENSSENDNSLGTTTRTYQNKTDEVDYIQYRTPRKSNVMDLGMWSGNGVVDRWEDWGGDPVIDSTWCAGAMLLDINHMSRKRWSIAGGGEIIGNTVAKEGNMVWCKGIFNDGPEHTQDIVGRQKSHTCYSHTGGRAKLSIECILMRWGNWIDITSPDEQSAANGTTGRLEFVNIHCGGQRYGVDSLDSSEVWVDNDDAVSHFYTDGNTTTLLPTMRSMKGEVEFLIPNDGQIRVGIEWIDRPAVIYSTQFGAGWNLYITSLSLEGYGDKVNTACDGLRHSFSNRAGGEYLSVETMLTTRGSDSKNGIGTGINARPGVVAGNSWNGYYLGTGGSHIPLAGVLMQQLKERYAQPQKAFTLTVDRRVDPYKTVWYAESSRECTIDAYDWDIYNNETTITID